jgi:SpoVK/Ycf46/Vps4 family AAA+-type ATPase
MSIFDFIFRKDLSEEAQVLHNLAREQLSKGNIKKASVLLEEAIGLDGEHEDLESLAKDIEKARVSVSNAYQNFSEDDPWVILVLEEFDLEQVQKYTEGKFLVEQVTVANGNWHIVLRHRNQNEEEQRYLNVEALNDNTFNEYIKAGYTIKNFGYDHREWFFVFEHEPEIRNQAWTFSPGQFPKEELKDWEKTDGRILHLVDMYGDYFTLASFPNRLLDYRIESFKKFPEEKIDEYWAEDIYIDYLAYVQGKYLLFSSKQPGLHNQGYYIDGEFPGKYILEKMKKGHSIKHLSFRDGQWFVLYNDPAPPSAKKITLTEDDMKGEQFQEIINDLKGTPKALNDEDLEDALRELKSLVGLKSVKEEIDSLVDFMKITALKKGKGFGEVDLNTHMVFSGSPGTGKTTVARLLGKVFLALGILEKGHVVEVDRSDLVAGYIGKTAPKTLEKIEESYGGILFIDEAYALYNSGENDFGHEAVETLLKAMEDDRDKFCVILAGYTDEMDELLESNPGLKSRFGTHLRFPDFSGSELMSILKKMLLKSGHQMSTSAEEKAQLYLEYLVSTANRYFGNGREMRNLFEDLLKNQSSRLALVSLNKKEGSPPLSMDQLRTINLEDLRQSYAHDYKEKEEETFEDILAELNELVGMHKIKEEVLRLANYLAVQQQRNEMGLEDGRPTLHAVFLGPPGTGKTTIARKLARIFKSIGLLKTERVVEVSRGDLVAGYIGQTALKTNKVIDRAMHGILFIDEAYSLTPASQNDFGQEAIATLLKRMEDERDKLVVIVAGYQNEMVQFLSSNPGLDSRFNRKFYFQPFTAIELRDIFSLMVKKSFYQLEKNTLPRINEIMVETLSTANEEFGNARWVRTLFEHCKLEQASRINQKSFVDETTLQMITVDDIERAYKRIRRENVLRHHKEKKKVGF